MYFFQQFSGPISQSTVIGSWDVSGYQQIAIQAWAQGPSGATLQLNGYFNNLIGVDEKLTLGPAPSSFAILTKVYPVYAPTLHVVLSNPSASLNVKVRLYAACCEPPTRLTILRKYIGRALAGATPTASAEDHRKLSGPLDLVDLIGSAEQPASGQIPEH
jgi:hypothetical protein